MAEGDLEPILVFSKKDGPYDDAVKADASHIGENYGMENTILLTTRG